jgi:hypothetical protein
LIPFTGRRGYAQLYRARWTLCLGRLLEVYEHALTLPASLCCLHLSLALVQCCISSMLRIANLDFSYKEDYGYISNSSGTKYNYCPSPLHPYLKPKAILLDSINHCHPQTSWHYFSISASLSISHAFRTFQLLPFQLHIKSTTICNVPTTPYCGEANLRLLLPMRKWSCFVEKPATLRCLQQTYALQLLQTRDTVALAPYYSSGMLSLA